MAEESGIKFREHKKFISKCRKNSTETACLAKEIDDMILIDNAELIALRYSRKYNN